MLTSCSPVTNSTLPAEVNVVVTVSYARSDRFDLAYLASSHMALCKETWAPSLLGFTISTFAEGPLAVVTTMYWDSKEGFESAWKLEGTKKILADVQNYTDAKFELAVGAVAARG